MTWDEGIAAQAAALRAVVARHVRPGEDYALLDYPDHPNVGDSAIWLGETRLLRAVTGRAPAYVARWDELDERALVAACPAGPILLHGGGNLGDLWPHHQMHRERVIAAFPGRTIVQLPQSVHFGDAGAARRFAGIAAGHGALHLYVRDAASRARLAALGLAATLAPDAAFALGPQARRGAADCAVLALMRGDAEAAGRAAPAGAVVVDWLEDGPLPPGAGGPLTPALADALAQARVERGLATLSRGEQVVTDRLHGHILATLLGIPHVAFDNLYGKTSAYVAAWSAGWSGVEVRAG